MSKVTAKCHTENKEAVNHGEVSKVERKTMEGLPRKRLYSAPALVVYGDISELKRKGKESLAELFDDR